MATYDRLVSVLMESLNVDREEVTPQSTLHHDLGAESIDFLDIVFRLEREFGVRIDRHELFPDSIFQGDPDMVKDGYITDKGMEVLRTAIPFADLTNFSRQFDDVKKIFTVDFLTRYITMKLEQKR